MDGLDELMRNLQTTSGQRASSTSSSSSGGSGPAHTTTAAAAGHSLSSRGSSGPPPPGHNRSTGGSSRAGAGSKDEDEWGWGDDDHEGASNATVALASTSSSSSSSRSKKVLSIRRPDPTALPSPEREHLPSNKSSNKSREEEEDWDDWGEEGATERRQQGYSNNSSSTASASGDAMVMLMSEAEAEAVAGTEALLREVLQDLVDEDARARLNAALDRDFRYDAVMEYYSTRPDLAEYTMKHELDRMHYTVVYDGVTTSDKLAILSIYQRTPLNDLWRMANQSIYADLMTHLQRAYLSPDVALGVQSSASSFRIDLDSHTLTAEGHFVFTAPTSLQTGAKRELGGVVGCVEVHLGLGHTSSSNSSNGSSISSRMARAWIGTPSLWVLFDSDLRLIAMCSVKLLHGEDESESATTTSTTTAAARAIAAGLLMDSDRIREEVRAAGRGLLASALRSIQGTSSSSITATTASSQSPRESHKEEDEEVLGANEEEEEERGQEAGSAVAVEEVVARTTGLFMQGLVGTVGRLLGAAAEEAAGGGGSSSSSSGSSGGAEGSSGPAGVFSFPRPAASVTADSSSSSNNNSTSTSATTTTSAAAEAGALLAEALRSRREQEPITDK